MNEIERTQRRTRGYWYRDGIAELVGGVALALVGVPLMASARTGFEMLSTIALMGMILLFPASAKVVRLLKDRITHTRTGYVKYPQPTMSKRRKIILASLFLAVAIAMLVALWGGEYTLDSLAGRVLLIGSGAAMAVAFAIRAIKLRMPRMFIIAVATAAVTGVNGFAGIGFTEGFGLLLAILGATSVITGAVTLIAYIRRHPKPPVDAS